MERLAQEQIDARKKFVEAWNKTMIDIWAERIYKLHVMDTNNLYHSPKALEIQVGPDGRFYDIELSQTYLEYGIWQDMGVGREIPHGNSGDIGHENKRKRRRWASPKYYSSVMNLRDFMAESLGNEFKGMFCDYLDSDRLKRNTDFYKRKGYV